MSSLSPATCHQRIRHRSRCQISDGGGPVSDPRSAPARGRRGDGGRGPGLVGARHVGAAGGGASRAVGSTPGPVPPTPVSSTRCQREAPTVKPSLGAVDKGPELFPHGICRSERHSFPLRLASYGSGQAPPLASSVISPLSPAQ